MIAELFIPCFVDQMYPDIGHSMVKILKKTGVEVKYNKNQTCCGQVAFNSGFWDEARDVAKKFLNDFSGNNHVVCAGCSCSAFVKNNYHDLFEDTILYNQYTRLKNNMFELTDYLVNVLKITQLGSVFPHKVTIHDSCASLRDYKLKDEPRILLRNVKGLEIVELTDNEVCCGFGGTFSVKFPSISSAMSEQKVQNALNTGAEYITSVDSSCLMNVQSYIDKNNLPIKTIHIANILASGL